MASNYPITATGAAAAAALATALGAAITVGGIAGDPTTTRGDMSFRGDAGGGTTAQTRLAVGTTGQVLTVTDAGEPTWRTPAEVRHHVNLCAVATVDATQGTVAVGGSPGSLDPATTAVAGRTQSWTFVVSARVTSGQTGTVVLYDLTADAVAATITVTATAAGTEHTETVTLPGTARRYEVRASVTGTTAAHYLVILNAAMRHDWS